MPEQEEKLIPLAEAAQRLGVTPIALRKAIYRKRFEAQQLGRDWFTTDRAIANYDAQRKAIKRGRPSSLKK
jgi:hypothetical protein